MERVAVAFSGGVDSSFLVKTAHDVLGENCIALTALSPAFPEQAQAKAFCDRYGIRQVTFSAGVLTLDQFVNNPPDRCYHCKKFLFQQMKEIAAGVGFSVLVEGSNVDDLSDYRPGLQALTELGIQSPLREWGMTKEDIRTLSREMGLPTWNQPSAACLASRIPYGEQITGEKLERIAAGEGLLHRLELRRCRLRVHGGVARIEVEPKDFSILLSQRESLCKSLHQLGFAYVTLDLDGIRTGSMNEVLPRKEEEPLGTA